MSVHAHNGQSNHHHGLNTSVREQSRSSMMIVLCLTATFMIAEVAVGFFTGSLALLADAGHMLSDVGAISLALIALWFSSKPATDAKTFGYYRSEILAGFVNSLALVVISVVILIEAYNRLQNPPEVMALPALATAVFGLIINIISLKLLGKTAQQSVNVKAAYLELMSDMLGLAGVIISSIIIICTKWYVADAIVSGAIGMLIIPRTWVLLKECTHILMEGTPDHVDLAALRTSILSTDGVVDVHDIHVWTLTSNIHALSAHVLIDANGNSAEVLKNITDKASSEFGLNHTTIQVEHVAQSSCGSSKESCSISQKNSHSNHDNEHESSETKTSKD